ncbi:MAG: cyclopropane-fatty-acyl-phospholipid synthase family protein, partial [Pseudomonadota bacterium]
MLAQRVTDKILKKLDGLESGSLELTTPDGKQWNFQGKHPGANANIKLHDWNVVKNMAISGDIGFADDYRSGNWESDDLESLTMLALENKAAFDKLITGNKLSRVMSSLSYLLRVNTLKGSKKNIHAHYDLGNDFYKLWLDPTMTYSSALYEDGKEDLVTAQNKKYDRMVDRLDAQSGSILEVGCGWGGFAERAADRGDYDIKGITLSEEQHDYARDRLGEKADIVLEDYRHQDGKFDNIISIEMFEAVGEKYWQTYFQKISSLMKDNGKAVIQTITMNERDFPRYRKGGDFIRSFIFPGGMLPSVTRFQQEANKAGLRVNDTYMFGQDYSKTLSLWLKEFDKKKEDVKALGFDDGFIRLWRFYLAACAAGFATGR